MYAQDSIDLLQNSGLQFREHEEHGIEPLEFAELLMSSGKTLILYYIKLICININNIMLKVNETTISNTHVL